MGYQLQYNRYSGLALSPKWVAMPEGRGVKVPTRIAAEKLKRDYFRACRKVWGKVPDLELRIAKVPS